MTFPPKTPADWQKLEAAHLKNIRQVTSDFVRAGEGYFSPDGKQIIFQAEEKGTGNPFYQIFVMDLDTGTCVEWFRLDGAVAEIFDVTVLKGVGCPMSLGFASNEIRTLITY